MSRHSDLRYFVNARVLTFCFSLPFLRKPGSYKANLVPGPTRARVQSKIVPYHWEISNTKNGAHFLYPSPIMIPGRNS